MKSLYYTYRSSKYLFPVKFWEISERRPNFTIQCSKKRGVGTHFGPGFGHQLGVEMSMWNQTPMLKVDQEEHLSSNLSYLLLPSPLQLFLALQPLTLSLLLGFSYHVWTYLDGLMLMGYTIQKYGYIDMGKWYKSIFTFIIYVNTRCLLTTTNLFLRDLSSVKQTWGIML